MSSIAGGMDPLQNLSAGDFLLARQLAESRKQSDQQARGALLALADAIDDASRLLEHPSTGEVPDSWREGLRILRDRMAQRLEEQGVDLIPTVGQSFDPRLHRVVEVVTGPGEPESIVQQLRAGYVWNGAVLRAAEVVTVASAPSASPAGENQP